MAEIGKIEDKEIIKDKPKYISKRKIIIFMKAKKGILLEGKKEKVETTQREVIKKDYIFVDVNKIDDTIRK
jgi:hypothetical protein